MANFNSLPFEIHRLIFLHLWSNTQTYSRYWRKVTFSSARYNPPIASLQESDIYPYASLNHSWRALIQHTLWSHITIAPFEIPVLRELLESNPSLAGYITTLTIRSRTRTPNDPPRDLDEYTHNLMLNLVPEGRDTLEGAKIYTIWREILLLQKQIRHLSGPRPISIEFFVNLGKGREYRFVDLPASAKQLRLEDALIRKLTFEFPRSRHGDQLSAKGVRSLLSSVGPGLEELHLICTDIEEPRFYRRELYAGLCGTVPILLSNIAPNLTRFTLTYPSFTPFNDFETRIYPLTLLDDNVDLLSRALRVLSKQLVSFQYYGGRVSSELFAPLPEQRLQPNELASWPNLQVYIVHFAPITPSGVWMFDLYESDYPDWYEIDEDDSEMTADDHEWIDQAFYEDNYYLPYNDPLATAKSTRPTKPPKPPRYISGHDGAGVVLIRDTPTSLIHDLLLSATHAMVGRMPKIRYWNVTAHKFDPIGLKFDYSEQGPPSPGEDDRRAETCIALSKHRGRPRLHFDTSDSYKVAKDVTSPWRKAFRGWKPGMEMAMPALEEINMEELTLKEVQDSASGMEPVRGCPPFGYETLYLGNRDPVDAGGDWEDVASWEIFHSGQCW